MDTLTELTNYSFVVDGLLAGCAEPSTLEDAHVIISRHHRVLVDLREAEHAHYPEEFCTALTTAGVKMINIPVVDFAAPSIDQMLQFCRIVEDVIEQNDGYDDTSSSTNTDDGKGSVLVHCRAGIGRTGTMLAAAVAYITLRLYRRTRPSSRTVISTVDHIAESIRGTTVASRDIDIDEGVVVQYVAAKRSRALKVESQRAAFHDFVEHILQSKAEE